MRQKVTALAVLGLCVILMIATVFVSVWRFGGTAEEMPGTGASENAGTEETAETAEPKEDDRSLPDLVSGRLSERIEKQPRPADAAYFANAAFLVNSVSQGLDLYDYDGLLAEADFYGEEELSCFGAMEYIRAMEGEGYGKVYIGLGVNELGHDIENIRPCYENMLAQLKVYDENMTIVLMSVPPVSAYKSDTDYNCTQANVLEYNEMLLSLAAAWDVWYLDVYSVLGDQEGYLPSEVTMDGIHFTPAYYGAWFETLANFYVNDGTVPAEPLPTEAPEREGLPAA